MSSRKVNNDGIIILDPQIILGNKIKIQLNSINYFKFKKIKNK